VAQRKTQTTKYWVEDFQISQSDLDHLYGVLLEQETPLSAEEMSLILVRFRVEGESSKPDSKRKSHNQYLPTEQYEVGTRLEFGSMGFVAGEVTATRPGDNPAYGEYEVLQVRFSENETLECASGWL
jgi:hypothetical protein